MKYLFYILFVTSHLHGIAQLGCKTTTSADGGKLTVCLHHNKQVSTSEIWDKDNRSGKIVGFDSQGKQLFYYSLRRFGGHSSVSVSYFPNGQVAQVDHSDAPDGGIQFYNSTIKFDEWGKQIDFTEMRYPPERITYVTTPSPVKKEPQPVTAACAVPFFDYFKVKNSTKSKILFRVTTKPSFNYSSKEFYFTLLPGENIVFDSIVSADFHPKSAIYEPIIVSYTKNKKNKLLRLTASSWEDKSRNHKTWVWEAATIKLKD